MNKELEADIAISLRRNRFQAIKENNQIKKFLLKNDYEQLDDACGEDSIELFYFIDSYRKEFWVVDEECLKSSEQLVKAVYCKNVKIIKRL